MRRLALAILLGACTPGAFGQNMPSEYEVKAAYLFNFAKYLEWPAEAFTDRQAPLTLCVSGRDPFGGALAAYERRMVQARELRVRRSVGLDELRGCHMLFLAESEAPHVQQFLRAAARLPIITVSDIDGFTAAGGTIGLVDAGARVQFEINLASAQRAGVKVNSQLLRIARNTREKIQ
jgi:hypothetical protein